MGDIRNRMCDLIDYLDGIAEENGSPPWSKQETDDDDEQTVEEDD